MLGLENPVHLLFLLVILLLLFGAKRLPEMGKSLGSGIRGFKDSLTSDDSPAAPESAILAAQASTPVTEDAPQALGATASTPVPVVAPHEAPVVVERTPAAV